MFQIAQLALQTPPKIPIKPKNNEVTSLPFTTFCEMAQKIIPQKDSHSDKDIVFAHFAVYSLCCFLSHHKTQVNWAKTRSVMLLSCMLAISNKVSSDCARNWCANMLDLFMTENMPLVLEPVASLCNDVEITTIENAVQESSNRLTEKLFSW